MSYQSREKENLFRSIQAMMFERFCNKEKRQKKRGKEERVDHDG